MDDYAHTDELIDEESIADESDEESIADESRPPAGSAAVSEPTRSVVSQARRNFLKTAGIAVGSLAVPLSSGGASPTDVQPDDIPIAENGDFCGLCADCPEELLEADGDVTTGGDESLPEFGEWECVVLLVHFEDTEPVAPAEDFDAFVFGDRSGVGQSEESLTDYWEQASYGQFTLTSGSEGVGGWYEVPLTEQEYEDADREYDLLWNEAVKAAKDAGYDFSAYDNPLLLVFRSGGEGPAWGGPGGTYGDVSFSGSTLCWTQPSMDDLRMGVPAHEIGHALGLPHHYNDGVDGLPLMSGAGTFNTPPSLPCAQEKNNIGTTGRIDYPGRSDWTETTEIWLESGEPLQYPLLLPPAAAVDENYRIWDGTRDDGSRYVLEYRAKQGIDRNLGASNTGLAVYYLPTSSDYEHNLAGDATELDGTTYSTADASIRKPNAQVEFDLSAVDDAYGCVQCNEPPHRSVSPGTDSVYAVPIDLDDLPPGTATGAGGETRIDARVSWADDTNDVSLELIAPDGTNHASSRGTSTAFDVVRSERLDSENAIEGGWKLVVSADGTDTAEYYRAVNHPEYELATTLAVDEVLPDDQSLSITVDLSYGDGTPYDPGSFGPVTADQFDIGIEGEPVDSGQITVSAVESGRYSIDAEALDLSPDDSLSLTFTDEKAGATHTTNTVTRTINGVQAVVDVSPAEPVVDKPVNVDASESSTIDGSLAQYEWDFGDGTTATGETVQHTYESPGEYEITLVVTDDSGTTAQTSTVVAPKLTPVSYANDKNVVDTGGLRAAVRDWQRNRVDSGLLAEILDAWQSGSPIQ